MLSRGLQDFPCGFAVLFELFYQRAGRGKRSLVPEVSLAVHDNGLTVWKWKIDDYWSWDVILSHFGDVLGWVLTFVPGSGQAVDMLIGFLVDEAIGAFIDHLAGALGDFAWAQAMSSGKGEENEKERFYISGVVGRYCDHRVADEHPHAGPGTGQGSLLQGALRH